MKLTRLKVAVLVPGLLALSACAAVAASQSELTLHRQDAGRRYTVHVGDTVRIDLLDTFGVPGSSTVWQADTSNPSVLSRLTTSRQMPPSIMNSQGHYIATFRAQKSGEAIIKLVGAASCEAMNPAFCPQPPSGSIAVTVS